MVDFSVLYGIYNGFTTCVLHLLQGLFLGFTLGLQYHWVYIWLHTMKHPLKLSWSNPHIVSYYDLGINVRCESLLGETHIYTSYYPVMFYGLYLGNTHLHKWRFILGLYKMFFFPVYPSLPITQKTTAPSASLRPKRRRGVLRWPNGRAWCLPPWLAIAVFFLLSSRVLK